MCWIKRIARDLRTLGARGRKGRADIEFRRGVVHKIARETTCLTVFFCRIHIFLVYFDSDIFPIILQCCRASAADTIKTIQHHIVWIWCDFNYFSRIDTGFCVGCKFFPVSSFTRSFPMQIPDSTKLCISFWLIKFHVCPLFQQLTTSSQLFRNDDFLKLGTGFVLCQTMNWNVSNSGSNTLWYSPMML